MYSCRAGGTMRMPANDSQKFLLNVPQGVSHGTIAQVSSKECVLRRRRSIRQRCRNRDTKQFLEWRCMENHDQGGIAHCTDARCNALDLFKSNGSRMERARHKLEITPPQRAVRIRIPAHIVLLGYCLNTVAKAGRADSTLLGP